MIRHGLRGDNATQHCKITFIHGKAPSRWTTWPPLPPAPIRVRIRARIPGAAQADRRRFPVTVWLRKPEEFDYIVEPDVFHDFFGHVPLLFDAQYADHLREYGKGGLKALRLNGLTFLARLYWHTIEFGLMHTPEGVRAYGAGLLSSGGELAYAVGSPEPRRLPFDVLTAMRTPYKIDSYQPTYFVIESFEQLLRETEPDFGPMYGQLNAEAVSATR